ncbi:MAG: hypothetical protein HYY50_04645 [Candidatus Kerfeldbacteria bacterium]|nr:hypothetical protein [Candidatus Kerfeldbacteria bacterium]
MEFNEVEQRAILEHLRRELNDVIHDSDPGSIIFREERFVSLWGVAGCLRNHGINPAFIAATCSFFPFLGMILDAKDELWWNWSRGHQPTVDRLMGLAGEALANPKLGVTVLPNGLLQAIKNKTEP